MQKSFQSFGIIIDYFVFKLVSNAPNYIYVLNY